VASPHQDVRVGETQNSAADDRYSSFCTHAIELTNAINSAHDG
jgi:hypothetical protein